MKHNHSNRSQIPTEWSTWPPPDSESRLLPNVDHTRSHRRRHHRQMRISCYQSRHRRNLIYIYSTPHERHASRVKRSRYCGRPTGGDRLEGKACLTLAENGLFHCNIAHLFLLLRDYTFRIFFSFTRFFRNSSSSPSFLRDTYYTSGEQH